MWSWPWVVLLSGFSLRCRRWVGCSLYLPKVHGSSRCTFSLVASCDVAVVVCCNSTFLASTSAGVRVFRLLLLYIWCEFAHFTQNFAPHWAAISSPSITVRLTYLARLVRIKPNFQGLPWSEFDGLGNDELLTLFLVYWWSEGSFAFIFSQLVLILYMFWLYAIDVARITLPLGVFPAH